MDILTEVALAFCLHFPSHFIIFFSYLSLYYYLEQIIMNDKICFTVIKNGLDISVLLLCFCSVALKLLD